MRNKLILLIFLASCLGIATFWLGKSGFGPAGQGTPSPQPQAEGYAGSVSCRECHEKFYKLWAPSHHGLAMQPFTPEFGRSKIVPQKEEIKVGDYQYRVEIKGGSGWVLERGPKERKRYRMEQVLGGKNIYYFLTPLEKGRLQVLPVAYDVRRKEWFDTTASMIRHFADVRSTEPVHWRDQLLTFNTACYSCHVSQLSTNYDLQTDTYHTVWAEPGINCETCHGPGAEHNWVCKEAPKGTVPTDLKIISTKKFTVQQHNSTCSVCHAKMIPLTAAYRPGERFFDHFDLVTLEDLDFSPDARDLGENFTLTLWLTSPCVKSGKLSCMHCHTSSGRYRFKDEAKANQACLPCHAERVARAAEHIHHPVGKPGIPIKCISCHMPMTEFARMRRSDHSMRPPTPAASLAFKSPNACNLCHRDKDAAWADKQVRKWRKRDYQAPVLYRGGLIQGARKRDWIRLPQILKYITSQDRDEVFATSLIRLLAFCPDDRKWPTLRQALKDPSPLVRGAAAAALEPNLTPETRDALLAATKDEFRVVRIRAAGALAAYPREVLNSSDRDRLRRATQELLESLISRPDQWTSHYNLGNYYLARGELKRSLAAFEIATKLQPATVLPLVNAAMAQARLGKAEMAEQSLRQALKIEPANAAANFNLGLLLAEKGDLSQAERAFRRALKTDPNFPEAAYNLAVLLAKDRLEEALRWSRKAHELRPQNPRYAYTLAFFMRQAGGSDEAIRVLRELLQLQPAYAEAYFLLGDIYEKQGKPEEARGVYRQALAQKDLSKPAQSRLAAKLQALSAPESLR